MPVGESFAKEDEHIGLAAGPKTAIQNPLVIKVLKLGPISEPLIIRMTKGSGFG